MFPFWDVAIAPVLDACGARRVVEIGALRGENTLQMLDHLGPDAELHVIDPVPDFDPAEHEQRFGGRYIFHEALSVDVLGGLPPMDAALIDGDHNWYTVYNELRLLAEVTDAAGLPMPVMILHDVLWPYGRRDLYYDPSNVPEEHRQPFAYAGMRPGRSPLLARGGLNPRMANAETEGGARNGVMTGLDDFIAERGRPMRRVVLPIYFGLAVVVEESRLEAEPQLAEVLDRLESPASSEALLELAEDLRLKAMVFQHNVHFQSEEKLARATARYLEVTKASLLNEHYLDHELRLELLAGPSDRLDPVVLRDPARHVQQRFRALARHRSGPAGPDPTAATSFVPYTAMGRSRLDHLERCLDSVRTDPVEGDLIECGTGRGGGAMFMRAYLEGHEIDDRVVWVADEFRAAPEPDRAPSLPKHGVAGFHADLNLVRDGFERFGILDDRVRFLQGSPPSVLADAPIEQIALLRIGAAAAADLDDVLEASYDHVAAGGYVIVEGDTATREIVERFRTARDVTSPLERVDDGTVAWRRGIDDRTATPGDEPEPARAGGTHVPLAPLAPPETLDLSVVVVFYEMRREAERTLRALSRAYQEGLDDIDYEVIVVENGSSPEQRLGEEYVRGFGSEFRYVDLADAAAPSPVGALNRGIREGRGNAFALMIDGAHVLTPGVLRYGLAGLSTYDPAIVATQQWYVGPGQQGDAMDNGYDQAYEDRLFDLIAWPTAGYRLFEIGHFVGDRDWLDGLWESNCMFVRRAQLEQVGAFDEGFDMAGGGYANLELYERLGAHAGVNVTTILGEGSFHQSHGGTTTNQPDAAERRARVFGYSQHYADRRGRAFKGPGKPIHYVGRFETAEARRSKPRRISAARFAEAAAPGGVDGPPEVSTPVPDELAEGFVEAVWMNRPWDDVRWLGHDFDTAPADAFAYQEMISEATPDWIIETGGGGGRSLFLATMCELVGHGEVIAVSEPGGDDRPEHERLHHVDGAGGDEAVAATIRRMVGSERALVVLGSRSHRRELVKEFEAYAPLVPVGSWVVVTDTIVNGNPVWAGFGPGPAEAVKSLLQHHGEFARDPDKEKYSFTFNPGGYLRRVS